MMYEIAEISLHVHNVQSYVRSKERYIVQQQKECKKNLVFQHTFDGGILKRPTIHKETCKDKQMQCSFEGKALT